MIKPKTNADKAGRHERTRQRVENAAVAHADKAISKAEERRLARLERRAARRESVA